MNKVRVVVDGTGRVASSHLQGATRSELVEIVGLVNHNVDKAKAMGEKFGIENCFSTIEEANEKIEFDAVDICLPNFLHEEETIKCANLKKHVLLEKPMANTIEECERILKAAKDNGIKLMIGQSRRYFPAVLKSKDEAGEVKNIKAELYAYLEKAPTPWWNKEETAGGLMIPLWGNHIFDYIVYMMNEMPESIYCKTQNLNGSWEGEDEVAIIMTFKGKRFANVSMSWSTMFNAQKWNGEGKMLSSKDVRYQRFIMCDKGSLILDDETKLFVNGEVVFDEDDQTVNFKNQYDEFAKAVIEDRKPLTDGEVGLWNVAIQNACLLSAKENKVVYLKGEYNYE